MALPYRLRLPFTPGSTAILAARKSGRGRRAPYIDPRKRHPAVGKLAATSCTHKTSVAQRTGMLHNPAGRNGPIATAAIEYSGDELHDYLVAGTVAGAIVL